MKQALKDPVVKKRSNQINKIIKFPVILGFEAITLKLQYVDDASPKFTSFIYVLQNRSDCISLALSRYSEKEDILITY